MRLSASNIGWSASQDEAVWAKMRQLGYTGLEIAPPASFRKDPTTTCPARRCSPG